MQLNQAKNNKNQHKHACIQSVWTREAYVPKSCTISNERRSATTVVVASAAATCQLTQWIWFFLSTFYVICTILCVHVVAMLESLLLIRLRMWAAYFRVLRCFSSMGFSNVCSRTHIQRHTNISCNGFLRGDFVWCFLRRACNSRDSEFEMHAWLVECLKDDRNLPNIA